MTVFRSVFFGLLPAVKIVEHMFQEAFQEAEKDFRIGSGDKSRSIATAARDPKAYTLLGDWVVQSIEASDPDPLKPGLARAREILGVRVIGPS
eukprot:615691-Prorocentrum_minimum.AAC.1